MTDVEDLVLRYAKRRGQTTDDALVDLARKAKRFFRLKAVVSVVFGLAVVGVGVLLLAKSILLALVVFFVGEWVAAYVVGPLVMLPVGALMCGPGAVRILAAANQRRSI
jgi:hypothetical protein